MVAETAFIVNAGHPKYTNRFITPIKTMRRLVFILF